ncbi:MAG: hypothetical protein NC311_12255 [Muribaculaceae bacterium]|nr:hypothetical protein [Muribaculaceae bacterium]
MGGYNSIAPTQKTWYHFRKETASDGKKGDEIMNWILQNKDIPILSFSTEKDEFGDVTALELRWESEQRPVGYHNIQQFLERRKAPKHRKHIDRLLAQYGCQDLEGFLTVSHALSLNDTFWMKPAGSSLRWENVSLYRNDFDEIIAEAALNGNFSETSLSATSPEFGTDGQYAKCWKREPDGIFLYKGGSAAYELEPLSEYLASQLAEKLCPDAVRYDMAFYHDRLVSTCPLFTSEEIGLAKTLDVVGREHRVAELFRYFSSIGSEDAFRRMCVLDAVILNIDRHLGNFGVLFNNDTMEILGMAPVFDNNRSLLFDLDEDQLRQAGRHLSRYTPRLGAGFIETGRALMTPTIRADLAELRDFEFAPHPNIRVEGDRLQLLSGIVRGQVHALLE